jgi:hypothetical protein
MLKTSRKLCAYAVAASMLVATAGAAVAQSATTNSNPGLATSGANTDTGNRGDEHRFDWGWLGLLGLAGLAGLMRKERAPLRDSRVGATTAR